MFCPISSQSHKNTSFRISKKNGQQCGNHALHAIHHNYKGPLILNRNPYSEFKYLRLTLTEALAVTSESLDSREFFCIFTSRSRMAFISLAFLDLDFK